ncbi:GNAT family N-acetyltransferase [candidate division WOR-3 bacterium]|uniref:GNAT family N-acetyltransferase n=1 Tax=candidate division WOR-3 bacterium TaxID=2052148 RepID=A0A9D5K9V9_UNCW3|nr:GNAT family N-acetyltransferase [candidate division WOR-3 bacterium]
MKKSAENYIKIIDPRFVKLVALDDKVAGFCIGIPDMTSGIRAAGGRLFPFGILKITRARKRSKRLDMIAGAIEPEHQGKGLDVLMTNAIYESAEKAGLLNIDSRLVLENNTKMRGVYEKLGGRVYKRYRLFSKEL